MDNNKVGGTNTGVNPELGAALPDPRLKPGAMTQMRLKKALGWKIATGVLVIVLVGTIGFLTYHFLSVKHDENQCEEKICEVEEIKDETTGEIVKVVKVPVGNSDDDVAVREIADKLFQTANEMVYDGGWHPNLVQTYGGEIALIYQPEGLKTATGLTLSYGFKFVWDGKTDYGDKDKVFMNGDLNTALVSELKRNGFTEYPKSLLFSEQYINEKAGIVCALSGSGLPYEASCGSVNWYSIDNWDLKNELAEAYKKKEGSYPLILGVGDGAIVDSGYERYQTITVSTENAAGQFYRVSPDSEWIFFRGGQSAPVCSEFNTDDLKRAFAGGYCWNETTNESDTVKL